MNIKSMHDELESKGWLPDQIKADFGVSDVSQYRTERVLCLMPRSKNQLQDVLNLASLNGLPIYPYSLGNNWAFGGRIPFHSGAMLIDLSGLNAIEDYDEEFGTIRVEPGVSQGQLSDYLLARKSAFFLDVTGSGRETSVLGNTLERGIAYNSLRADSLMAMEVMLPDGSIINTGFSGKSECHVKDSYGFGLGPDLRGLFLQSNYGIVLSVVLKLKKVQTNVLSFQVGVPESKVGALVDVLADLMNEGILTCIPHIGDPLRVRSTMEPILRKLSGVKENDVQYVLKKLKLLDLSVPFWSCLGSIQGPKELVAAKKSILQKKLAPLGSVRFVSEKSVSFMTRFFNWGPFRPIVQFYVATESLRGLVQGRSTSDALHMLTWNPGEFSLRKEVHSEVFERSTYGVIFSVPLTKMNHHCAQNLISLARSFSVENDIILGMTLNALTSSVLEAVISFHFDPVSPRVAEIQSLFIQFNRMLISKGMYPYRMNPDLMKYCWDVLPHKQLSSKLKAALDPKNIVSPDHYVK